MTTADCIAPMLAVPPVLPWGHTQRLALREFHADDHDAIVHMHRDKRLRAHLLDDVPLDDPRVADIFLQRMSQLYRQHEGLGIWHATWRQPRPRFAGFFSLMPMAGRPGEVEIGSRLLPIAWGTGLVVEGCELLLDHAFNTLAVPHVWGTCHPANRSARAVLHALGFEPMGLLPYAHAVACHYRTDAPTWAAWRTQPRSTRLRRALRSCKEPS